MAHQMESKDVHNDAALESGDELLALNAEPKI